MSLYRCAICGSPNLAKMTEKDGFSYGKAAVGVAVFGMVGAIAGLDGKKTAVYKCPDCGHSMFEPMDEVTKIKIDACVSSPERRNQFNWTYLKQKYINIESGSADRIIKFNAESLDSAVNHEVERVNAEYAELRKMSKEELDEDEKSTIQQRDSIIAALAIEFTEIIQKEREELEAKQKQSVQRKDELTKEIRSIKDERRAIDVPSGLKLMLSSKAKAQKARFDELSNKLPKIEKELTSITSQVDIMQQKIANFDNDTQTRFGLYVKKQWVVKKLPLCIPAKYRLIDYDEERYSQYQISVPEGMTKSAEETRMITVFLMSIMVSILRSYREEIRQKTMENLFGEIIPNRLDEQTLKIRSKMKLKSCVGCFLTSAIDPCSMVDIRTERMKGVSGEDHDAFFKGESIWHYITLKSEYC